MAGASAACRRLMTIPGVGQVTALTFVAAIDDPFRIRRSRDIGAIWAWSQAVSVGGGRLHASWEGETDAEPVANAVYGQNDLGIYEMKAYADVSNRLMEPRGS
jgi:hypothetical protein